MKKILIIMPSMFIGGAERSLLGLLGALDYSKVEVSLFLYRHEGDFLNLIPEQVKLLPEIPQYRTFDVPIKSLLLSKRFLYGAARLLSKAMLRLHCLLRREKPGVWMSMQYTARFLQPLLPKLPGEYDLGIMFLGIADTLVNKVTATRKITWNHTDYDTLFPDRKMDLNTYSKIDALVSVSDACTEKVLAYYPQLEGKAITIENCLAGDLIRRQAEAQQITDEMPPDSTWRLLSIGRYCHAKNFDNIPDLCARLLKLGVDVKWYVIGFGGDEPLIRQRIAQSGMESRVILLGKKDNPYPYIRACDLYVQPSRYEGKCVTVREAQLLGKPVAITRYPTSVSQLEDGVDGCIVPMDNAACAVAIAALLRDPAKLAQLSQNCKDRDYSNKHEVEKLYSLM